jgi:hypothetical protein
VLALEALRGPGPMMLEMRRWIKENGLLIANLALFAAFFVGMIICGVQVYNADQARTQRAVRHPD